MTAVPVPRAAATGGRAPRPWLRALRRIARGARLALAVWAGLAAPALACGAEPWAAAVPGSEVMIDTADPAALSRAWYGDLSAAYGHGVLGDALEPTTLHAWSEATSAACGLSVAAGAGHVFEDVAPRLADVTGDGQPEVVVVRSSFERGAQLVIYALQDGALTVLAQSPYIGQRNRWLAPAAIADLDGDGRIEVAWVDRPHLAKILRIWRLADGAFSEVATASGVTNHRIGEAFISGGLRACEAGPEIVLASEDWTRLLALRFDGVEITARDIGTWSTGAVSEALLCAR